MPLSVNNRVRRVSLLAMLLGCALILSYIEALIPTGMFKLGLANISVTLTVFMLSRREGLFLMLCRVFIMSLLFGSAASFAFSLGGGIFAWAITSAQKRLYGKISLVGVSVLSSAAHNAGQVLAACITLGSPAPASMLWWLLLLSIPSGILTGLLAETVYSRIGGRLN